MTTESITNWELNKKQPTLQHAPKIISFLEYSPQIIKNEIRRYRIEKGLTQKELAKFLNIDQTTLARIEKGNSRIVSFPKYECLLMKKLKNLA